MSAHRIGAVECYRVVYSSCARVYVQLLSLFMVSTGHYLLIQIGGYPLTERDGLLELDYDLDGRYSYSSVRNFW
jgi:hypothetical protein